MEHKSLRQDVKVVKRGNKTGITEGILRGIYSSARIDSMSTPGHFYYFNNCFGVYDQDDGPPFFEAGDSGSGVFLIQNHMINPIGIAFARQRFKQLTLVCKIKDIAEKFNLSICQDAFALNMLRDQANEENMDIDTSFSS